MHVNREIDPDLSKVEQELKDPDRKITALELWNRLAAEVIAVSAAIKPTKSGSAPVKLYVDKMNKAIQALYHFETTKHRVLIDAIIYRLEGMQNEWSQTSVIRFAKRWRLRKQIEATRTVLLIVVNTPPPDGAGVHRVDPNQGPAKPAIK